MNEIAVMTAKLERCNCCQCETTEGVHCAMQVGTLSGNQLLVVITLCPECYLREECQGEPALISVTECGGS